MRLKPLPNGGSADCPSRGYWCWQVLLGLARPMLPKPSTNGLAMLPLPLGRKLTGRTKYQIHFSSVGLKSPTVSRKAGMKFSQTASARTCLFWTMSGRNTTRAATRPINFVKSSANERRPLPSSRLTSPLKDGRRSSMRGLRTGCTATPSSWTCRKSNHTAPLKCENNMPLTAKTNVSKSSKRKSKTLSSPLASSVRHWRGSRIEKLGDLLWAVETSDGIFLHDEFIPSPEMLRRSLFFCSHNLSLGAFYYSIHK